MKRRLKHGSSALPKPPNSARPELCPPPPARPPAGPALIFGADHPSGKAWHNDATDIGKAAQLWTWYEWLRLSLMAAALVAAGIVMSAKTGAERARQQSVSLEHTSPVATMRAAERAVDGNGGTPTAIGSIHYWSDDNSTTVTVDLQALVFFQDHRISHPDRIYFDIQGTRMPEELRGKPIHVDVGETFVRTIRMADRAPGVTRLVLETKQSCGYSAMIASAPYRLIVKLYASP